MSLLSIVIGAVVMLAGLSLFSLLMEHIGGRDRPGDASSRDQHAAAAEARGGLPQR